MRDPASGFIVAWRDGRHNPTCLNGCDLDYYAQKLDDAGASQWTPNGVALSAAYRAEEPLLLVSDGNGGAVLVWTDLRRQPEDDVYAQRVDATGAVQWGANGTAIADTTKFHTEPSACVDSGGAITVPWADDRHGCFCGPYVVINLDIYVGRLTVGGLLGVGEEPASPFQLRGPWPNPMTTTTALTIVLASPERMTVDIFDLPGQRVRTLAASQSFPGGTHTLSWDGRTDSGTRAGLGLYFVRILAGTRAVTRKAVVLR